MKPIIILIIILTVFVGGCVYTESPELSSILQKHEEEYQKNKLRSERLMSGVKELAIGMTEEEVVDLLGETYEKNRSVGSWGVHEQWIYRPYRSYPRSQHIDVKYLNFENGILTSYQE